MHSKKIILTGLLILSLGLAAGQESSVSVENGLEMTSDQFYYNGQGGSPILTYDSSNNRWVFEDPAALSDIDQSDNGAVALNLNSANNLYLTRNGGVMNGTLDLDGNTIVNIGGLQGTGIVNSNQLASNSVTVNKIASNAVTSNELSDDSVGSAQIALNAVGPDQLDETQSYNLDWSNLAISQSDLEGTDIQNLSEVLSEGNSAGSNDIDLSGNIVTGLPTNQDPSDAGTSTSDAVSIGSAQNLFLTSSGAVMSGSIDMDGNPILNLPTPTNSQDAANKAYVDTETNRGLSEVLEANSVANQTIEFSDGVSIGDSSTSASGSWSVALGDSSVASGSSAIALGRQANASEFISTAIGSFSSTSGNYATALGRYADASAEGSVAIGNNANSPNSYEATFGNLNGDELDLNVTGNAMIHGSGGISVPLDTGVQFGGDTSVSGTAPGSQTAVGSDVSTSDLFAAAYGASSEASSTRSTAIGSNAEASGPSSAAFGDNATSIDQSDLAAGHQSLASGSYSTALGNGAKASGMGSVALGGDQPRASAEGAVAIGSLAVSDQSDTARFGSDSRPYDVDVTGDLHVDGELTGVSTGAPDQGLSEVLEQDNIANQSIEFSNGISVKGASSVGYRPYLESNSGDLELKGRTVEGANSGSVSIESGDVVGSTPSTDLSGDVIIDVGTSTQVHGDVRLGGNADEILLDSNTTLMDNSLEDVADPSDPQDAATKSYVDSQASGVSSLSEVLEQSNVANQSLNMNGNSVDRVSVLETDEISREGAGQNLLFKTEGTGGVPQTRLSLSNTGVSVENTELSMNSNDIDNVQNVNTNSGSCIGQYCG